ncbi:mitochondrial protein Pet127-domain-containing protein [Infundibulicybe gibba]|nr:mitochondrial protein Pet127-domain-containing protein [Infundibulicybe gibba]
MSGLTNVYWASWRTSNIPDFESDLSFSYLAEIECYSGDNIFTPLRRVSHEGRERHDQTDLARCNDIHKGGLSGGLDYTAIISEACRVIVASMVTCNPTTAISAVLEKKRLEAYSSIPAKPLKEGAEESGHWVVSVVKQEGSGSVTVVPALKLTTSWMTTCSQFTASSRDVTTNHPFKLMQVWNSTGSQISRIISTREVSTFVKSLSRNAGLVDEHPKHGKKQPHPPFDLSKQSNDLLTYREDCERHCGQLPRPKLLPNARTRPAASFSTPSIAPCFLMTNVKNPENPRRERLLARPPTLVYDHVRLRGVWGVGSLGWKVGEKTPERERTPRNSVPLAYTRRIEGLLEPIKGPVLHEIFEQQLSPGVHWLQDPRSRVYNFTPWLETIPKVTEFAFERLAGFVKSSRDEDLWSLAKREQRTFAGSTSSLSGMLSQIYFLISGDKHVDISTLSQEFQAEPRNFTPGQRMPASVVMNYNDGVYSIDSDSDQAGHTEKNILVWMGTLLEKHLTMSQEEFTSYMRSQPPPAEEEGDSMREAYRFAKSQRFVMRSQLDCHDSRLPGTGVFDIKTRACLPIRLDILNFEENSGYLIRKQHGLMESFEREYYDLIRSAFLKYSFQARIGNMDGVIVAYHNTSRMFGFQYVPLGEMDERLFGPGAGGDRVFEKCIGLLEVVADEITRCFPDQIPIKSVRCTFETEEDTNVMNIWVEPAEWESQETRPIQQLQVQVSNYVGEFPIAGHQAVSLVDQHWYHPHLTRIGTVHWTLSKLSRGDDKIREALNVAKERQFRAYNLPTGVGAEEMAEFWGNLNFGGQPTPEGDEPALYKPENFKTAGRSIQRLRSIARAGREESERLALEEAGRPKSVLGEETPWDEDFQRYSNLPESDS